MKKIIKKIGAWLTSFLGKDFSKAKSYASIAVNVVQKLKGAVESPFANVIVNLIPGDIDDRALAVARVVIPKVAFRMAVTYNIISAADTNADAVAAITAYLKSLNKNARIGFWIQFSTDLTQVMMDGKITFSEAAMLTQMVYTEYYGSDE